MREGDYGVRAKPWTARERARELAAAPAGAVRPAHADPCCIACGRLICGVNPCPFQLSSQDAMLLGARVAGLDLDVDLPDDRAQLQQAIDEQAALPGPPGGIWTP